ncbi:hypothetical protein [Halovenus halobia]|uniref:hypothetical protein n=1 Tax=Halovenus halobia TaxID=3396622 RepID=UPI003F56223C
MEQNIDRRTALKLGGAATVAAVAGCSNPINGGGDGDGSGAGSYSQYLAVQNNQVFFAYADFQALEELDSGNQDDGSGGQMPNLEDPMLAPATGVFLIAFSAGFQLGALGLGGLLQTDSESNLNSSGEEVLIANSALVVTGEMDTDEISSTLTESGDQSFKTQYEQTGETGGYTLYEPAELSASGSSGSVVAVNDGELISAQNQSNVEAVIDAIDGSGRAADEFDEFSWLLNNGGNGVLALGGYGPDGYSSPGSDSGSGGSDTEFEFVNNSGGFVGSMTFDGDNLNSVIAASSDQITEDQQGNIESEFQSDRTDVSVDFKGNGRLVAEATYSRDVLQGSSDSS